MYSEYCMSSFLTLRYVEDATAKWTEDLQSLYPEAGTEKQAPVHNVDEINYVLGRNATGNDKAGVLLSSGIDSAIIASYLPKGTRAYTIRFCAPGATDESAGAAEVAEKLGLRHTIVDVHWKDYEQYADSLMLHKKSPLHPIEVALNKAARMAVADGIDTLIVGNGADSTFGGMDKLLSRDWTLDEFIQRYTFVNPAGVLKKSVSMRQVFGRYNLDNGFDVQGFLKTVHGTGIIQSFETALEAAGCRMVAPFEEMFLAEPLDIGRIRSGEPKYLLQELFLRRFPGTVPAIKIPFARPMDYWMKDWSGPCRAEFHEQLSINEFTGEQKWLIYILERFMNLFEGK